MRHVLDLQGLAEPHLTGFTDCVAPMGSVATVVESTWTTVFRLQEEKPRLLD